MTVFDFENSGINMKVSLPDDERIISSQLTATKVWEKNQLDLYYTLTRSEKPTMVDVGANVGINSMYFAKLFKDCSVYAIEAHPTVFNYLSENIDLNKLSITASNLAISDKKGQMKFTSQGGTNSHLVLDDEQNDFITVDSSTLDEFTLKNNIELIDILKIDVEGYTDLVLNGAHATLGSTKSAIVEVSYGDLINRYSLQDKDKKNIHRTIPIEEATKKVTTQFEFMRNYFKHFYFISRRNGVLVKISTFDDLFSILFLESPVGDILATNIEGLPSISPLGLAMSEILILKQQNGLRIQEDISLRKLLSNYVEKS